MSVAEIRTGTPPVYRKRSWSQRYQSSAIVITLHILIIWGILSGNVRNALSPQKNPLAAEIIQEVSIAPPPPSPPAPPKAIRMPEPAPRPVTPPPFVPAPDVVPAPLATAPVIEAVTTPPLQAASIAQTPPPTTTAPAPTSTVPVHADMALRCPTQIPPEMPRKALQDGTSGVVKAQALIRDGVVKEVTIVSGPRVFHAAVRAAMLAYQCHVVPGDVLALQEFVFKVE